MSALQQAYYSRGVIDALLDHSFDRTRSYRPLRYDMHSTLSFLPFSATLIIATEGAPSLSFHFL